MKLDAIAMKEFARISRENREATDRPRTEPAEAD
jgi:hypothetical protein